VAAKLATMPAHRPASKDMSANLPTSPVSQPAAANMLNISERLLLSAKVVQQGAAPELVAAVRLDDACAPNRVDEADIVRFGKLYTMNARPVQKRDRRFILSASPR